MSLRGSHVDNSVLNATALVGAAARRKAQDNNRVDLFDSPAQDQGHQGPGLASCWLAMAFKLIEAAEDRWRYVNGPALVALVRAGATFRKGVLVETVAKQEEVAA